MATLRYVLLTAMRDRLYGALMIGMAAIFLSSRFLTATALAEGRELGLAYAAMGSRTLLVLGIVIFVCFHVRRLHETREIETILTRPLSLSGFVLSYCAGFMVVAAGLVLTMAVLMAVVLQADPWGLLLWSLSMLLESALVVALSLFCAVSLQSAVSSALAAIGFYAVARLSTFFVDIAQHQSGSLFAVPGVGAALKYGPMALAALMPRLDLFGQTSWLVYGPQGGWGAGTLLLQTALYLPLLTAATVFDLRRKRF